MAEARVMAMKLKRKAGVVVCLGRHNEIPDRGGLHSRSFFPHGSGGYKSPDQGANRVGFILRPLSGLVGGCHLAVSSHSGPASLLHFPQRLHLHSEAGGGWLGLQDENLGGHKSVHSNRVNTDGGLGTLRKTFGLEYKCRGKCWEVSACDARTCCVQSGGMCAGFAEARLFLLFTQIVESHGASPCTGAGGTPARLCLFGKPQIHVCWYEEWRSPWQRSSRHASHTGRGTKLPPPRESV